MASITLKEIPPELHAQLKSEGAANFRSMQQEALSRIERSFALDDQFSTEQVNRLIEASLASGPEADFSWSKFDAAIEEARTQHAAQGQAQ